MENTETEKLLSIYKNYKSLLSSTASDIVAFKNSWTDEFCRQEINRIYDMLMKEFKDVNFLLFNENQLKELDFKWFNEKLLCMPTWALDCLKEGTVVYSINGKEISLSATDKLNKDTRFGVSAYGFNKSQIRDSKIKEILK